MIVGTHAAALVAACFPSQRGAVALAVGYALTAGFGISLGYHRGLSHEAFKAPRWVMRLLVVFGALAFQGGPVTWVAFHRAHHRFTDEPGDPHSAARGFWWSHIGWTLHKGPNGFRPRYMRRLARRVELDPVYVWLERHHLAVNVAAFAVAALVLGPSAAAWAFPLRIVLVWHLAWLTNSLGHGALPFRTRAPALEGCATRPTSARNLAWLSLLNFGEGLHHAHHTQPWNPRFSRGAGELDFGYGLLRLLAAAGLVALPRARMDRRAGLHVLDASGANK